ncbi:hypothetical protein OSB04_013587 [Centaurea solstitialis]|uniref:Uncharacterized protein n=1 Tax=Centaurea solstitialis TaxID=347529 RepID=A0AA38TDK3_9ASTR|nr:hypothetical protein OSB04_013587 [Centaurea solstitialis]
MKQPTTFSNSNLPNFSTSAKNLESMREEKMAVSCSDESRPLLSNQQGEGDDHSNDNDNNNNNQRRLNNVLIIDDDDRIHATRTPIIPNAPPPPVVGFRHHGYGWTANGLPLANGGVNVIGEPLRNNNNNKGQWDSGLYRCLGRNDEFCSSDLEVCILGSVAPCVVYGSNVERLGSAPWSFANHCLPYSGLYLIGNSFFGCNFIAPWFSYPTRTTIRRRFNLEASGNCEAMNRSCGGCCDKIVNDEEKLEQAEAACDVATHVFCHPCAICQEGREVRRRIPHPGFTAQPLLVITPPGEQTMARHSLTTVYIYS